MSEVNRAMGEIINLRQARKARQRSAEAERASERRAQFGRTKAQRDLERTEAENAKQRLEGHRLDKDT